MSDPVKNVEIEDVLASIRRLVSEEVDRERTATAVKEADQVPAATAEPSLDDDVGEMGIKSFHPSSYRADTAKEADMAPEALVLTPALRIDAQDAEEPEPEVAALHVPEDARSDPVDLSAYVAPSPDTSDEQAAEAEAADETEENASAPEAEYADPSAEAEGAAEDGDTQATVLARVPDLSQLDEPVPSDAAEDAQDDETAMSEDATRVDEYGAMAEALPSDATASTSGDTGAEERAALEETIARLESLVQQSPDAFEPEEEPRSSEALTWEDVDAPVAMSSEGADELDPPTEIADAETTEVADAEIEEAEAEAGLTPEQLASLTAGPAAAAPRDAAPRDAARDDADIFAERAGQEAMPSRPSAAPQEVVLDEDALRDLVAVLVREELRGPLGEKMTRNVRNLVRREVHRALASRDLD